MPPLIKAMRPRQWIKNLLVLAAPFAAGTLNDLDVLLAATSAFVAFTLVASAIYLLNDVRDAPMDREHPTKRERPIASGKLAPRTATISAVVLLVAGLALGTLTALPLGAVLAVYVVLQLGYVYWLKNEPVIDLAVVASGFLLRALAGGAATDTPISEWFLLVAGFGSLFMVAGKRYSEFALVAEGGTDAVTRASLAAYSAPYLRFVWTVAASVTVVVYGLWVITVPQSNPGLALATLVPFTLALMVYARDIDAGTAGEPEDVVLSDRTLQVLGVVWAGMLAAALYV